MIAKLPLELICPTAKTDRQRKSARTVVGYRHDEGVDHPGYLLRLAELDTTWPNFSPPFGPVALSPLKESLNDRVGRMTARSPLPGPGRP